MLFQETFQLLVKLHQDYQIISNKNHSLVNWREIKDFRNKLIHEYFGVNPEIVWNIIENDLPGLKTSIFKIIQSF